MKRIVLICLALFGLVAGVLKAMNATSKDAVGNSAGPEKQVVLSGAPVAMETEKKFIPSDDASATGPKGVLKTEDEDSPDLKALREQMSKERGIQQQIKLHNLELERTRVQLEQEKALAEMNQLRKANLGIIRDPSGNGTLSLPDTKVVFLSDSEKTHEAILTINGTNYTVHQGDKPLENVLVKSISSKGVQIVVNGDKEIQLTPNLME